MARPSGVKHQSIEIDNQTFDEDGFKYTKDEAANTKLTAVATAIGLVTADCSGWCIGIYTNGSG